MLFYKPEIATSLIYVLIFGTSVRDLNHRPSAGTYVRVYVHVFVFLYAVNVYAFD
jgi:hypothetical protein